LQRRVFEQGSGFQRPADPLLDPGDQLGQQHRLDTERAEVRAVIEFRLGNAERAREQLDQPPRWRIIHRRNGRGDRGTAFPRYPVDAHRRLGVETAGQPGAR